MDIQENSALSLLPEELWIHILDLTIGNNARTFYNCSLTCSLWYEILRQFKFRFQLPLILPHLYAYLSGRDILSCRLASKNWYVAVNQYNPTTEPKTYLRINGSANPNHMTNDRIILQNNAKDFMFRSIILTITPNVYQDFIQFFNRIKGYLRALHVQFQVRQITLMISELARILREIPSVKYLKLSALSVDTDDEISPYDIKLALKTLMFIPDLNLRALDVSNLPVVVHELFINGFKKKLILNNTELYNTCQVMSRLDDKFQWNGPIKSISTEICSRHLTHAHFSIFHDNFLTLEFQREIQKLGKLLEALSIKFIGENERNLNIIGNAAFVYSNQTILYPTVELASSFEFLIDLRNLEKLKIELTYETYSSFLKSKDSFNFMKNIIDLVKNLEELEEFKDDEIVSRKIYQSNIWSLLQNLKRFCIVIVDNDNVEGGGHVKRVYTRRDFNELYPGVSTSCYLKSSKQTRLTCNQFM